MLTYGLKYRNNTKCKNPEISGTKNGRIMLLYKYAVCGNRKVKFIKEQEASRLLSQLAITIPLSKIPLLRDILF